MNSMATGAMHGDERGIVVGARNHSLVRFAGRDGRCFKRGQNREVAGRRRVGVDQLSGDLDAAAGAHFFSCGGERGENAVAPRAIDVANVGRDHHARRDAVDRAGKHIADAHSADGVDRAGRFCRGFKREDQLGGRGQRIFAARHQLAAGVSAFALDHDALAGGCGDVRHQAHVDSFLLEIRALLDVQLDKLMKAATRHSNRVKRSGKPSLRAPFFKPAAFLVAQRERLLQE